MNIRFLHWPVRALAGKSVPNAHRYGNEDAPPLRAELFGMLQLESHAKRIAALHQARVERGPERLLARLKRNQEVIRESHASIVKAMRRRRHVAPAAEWLLDNYYLIDEQIRLALIHLPRSYSRELPRLSEGPYQGLPRVYDLILQLVSHTDSRVDSENLSRFIAAYQSVKALTLGELWAVPIMLRLTLIEAMRRVARRIAWRRRMRDYASEWTQRFLRVAHDNPKLFIAELADFVRSDPPEDNAFVAELASGTEGQDPSLGILINWLEQRLAARGQTLELVQQAESHEQAADQASIANTITTLRSMSRIDWREFVESLSTSESALRRDPSGVYGRSDFTTRDRCRHVVERLARRAGCPEIAVAEAAVALAVDAHRSKSDPPADHVAYYLVGKGIAETETAVGACPSPGRRIARAAYRHATAFYLLAAAAALLAVATPMLCILAVAQVQTWVAATAAACVLIVASRPAILLLQWIATVFVPPRVLPRLDFSAGIPSEHRTAVVVPTLLSQAALPGLIEDLEIRYMANRSPHALFGLLTDFPDAGEEALPGEDEVLENAVKRIRELNERHKGDDGAVFFLVHRPRVWNGAEKKWMGYERKRGKLDQFNRLIRNGDSAPFSVVEADIRLLRAVKYVLTLDADTDLPPGAMTKLVGTMAHPLNRPKLDPATRRVVEGYGILQPRLSCSLSSARASRYASIMAGDVGLDPYTREVSHFYHDIFARSPFLGKGIYDVEAFDTAVGGRFPENRILSHDLIESCYASCGFVSDVELVEDQPAAYLADSRRRHRWIRGDWQIARWILNRVPTAASRSEPNPLPLIARWMIFDNLRRSILPVVVVILAGVGFTALPQFACRWTVLLFWMLMLPEIARFARSMFVKQHLTRWSDHLVHLAHSEVGALAAPLTGLLALPYDACFSSDAILKALWRLLVSRRELLQWRTAADAERLSRTSFSRSVSAMAPASILAAGMAAASWMSAGSLSAACILPTAVWFASPALLWMLGAPLRSRISRLRPSDKHEISRIAFRSWCFFDRYASAEHNWLPPDNVQWTDAGEQVAARTSPTNIAMGLLCNLAAMDLGYAPAGAVIARTGRTLATLEKLEKYRGHLFNWYDTRSFLPLFPRYVSSVDSGNLLASLVVLRSGLLEMIDAPPIPPDPLRGVGDIIDTAVEEAEASSSVSHMSQNLKSALKDLRAIRRTIGSSSTKTRAAESILTSSIAAIETALGDDSLPAEARSWFETAVRFLSDIRNECLAWQPWHSDRDPNDDSRLGLPEEGDPALLAALSNMPLRELAKPPSSWSAVIARDGAALSLHPDMALILETVSDAAAERIEAIRRLAQQCDELSDMDMKFVYDPAVHLFHIGYDMEAHRLDPSYYDLLASEARLGSFTAIARGMVPLEHWFHMGRLLAPGTGAPVLLSWSGSMFEYLMPELLMPLFEGTLLGESARGAVAMQRRHASELGLPWGMSESGYNQVDSNMSYQYRAFGVPDLGLKRGLGEDRVIAPYATALALVADPAAAAANLRRLAGEGAVGPFGLYEALDYTPQRLRPDETTGIVRSHMSHHTGMALLAFDSVLRNRPMQRRFLADLEMRAAEILLQERLPAVRTAITGQTTPTPESIMPAREQAAPARRFESPDTPTPEVHLLSNGHYHVMVTNSGSGCSRWSGLSLTRWREDMARDAYGVFFYIRDTRSGKVWSPSHQPAAAKTDIYEATFLQGSAEFRTVANRIQTHLRIAVSAEDNIEIRRLTVTNMSDAERELEITSYAEIALAPTGSDLAHPAFNGLFMEAETLPEKSALIYRRRPRDPEEDWPVLIHFLVPRAAQSEKPGFELNRERFIGHMGNIRLPAAVSAGGELTPADGAMLDPVAAVRHRIVLPPGEAMILDAGLGVAPSREDGLSMLDKHMDSRISDRVFDVAWTHSQVLLHQLRASESEAQLFARLAGALVFQNRHYRAGQSIISRNRRGQSALWSYSVSGDRPILLLRVGEEAGIKLVRRMLQAHNYWKHKGLEVDMVIWVEAYAGYRQTLFDMVISAVHAGPETKILDQPGGVFVRNIDQVPEDDRLLFQACARVIINDRSGSLENQIDRQRRQAPPPPQLAVSRDPEQEPPGRLPQQRRLVLNSSLGGFTEDGREYVISLPPGRNTPAPWANVMANQEGFGSVVTETGGGYTWSENAHEFRLTPWHNDPVSDQSGEAWYVRDEETGAYWSPSPAPARGRTPYVCRHGLGYTVFEHTEQSIYTETHMYVTADTPAKCVLVILRNLSDRSRRISVTGYCELVLGERREPNAMHIVTRLDPQTGAVFASNAFNFDFPDRVAVFHASGDRRTFTGDRLEFLGRNGDHSAPAAMSRADLSNTVGAALDPCAAIRTMVEIPAREERRAVFVLGCARGEQEARGMIRRLGGVDGAYAALEASWDFWNRQLGGIHVQTPDPSVNFLVNHWLLYQVLTSRFWGRTGFYQSGGAYGFRDQLQDSTALLLECPWLAREHILLCASRQFPEGDAQHWWHPPTGRGIRSRISDTALWLPYAVTRYTETTGDTGLLDEQATFLEGRALAPDEESYYDLPRPSDETATVYEHCVRAIRASLKTGAHGLPLIGAGDWNDGMNRVGRKGAGESVWLAFFLNHVLTRFSDVAENKGDAAFARECRERAASLALAIEAHAWDGKWYRRAYFDDGSVLGSASNEECRIDSLPQSWAAISKTGSPERRATALNSACAMLAEEDMKLIRLFTPPFDSGSSQPGYIRGYVPGVRENGGQYTHAAVWLAMAMAEMNDAERAWNLFSLLNPVRHGDTDAAVSRYRIEPYVAAGDVYTAAGHEGRGGWSWYTGSAGWMYNLLIEKLLGLRIAVDRLYVRPLPHPDWKEYSLHYRYRSTFYHIRVLKVGPNPRNTVRITVNGNVQPEPWIHLADDGWERNAVVEVG